MSDGGGKKRETDNSNHDNLIRSREASMTTQDVDTALWDNAVVVENDISYDDFCKQFQTEIELAKSVGGPMPVKNSKGDLMYAYLSCSSQFHKLILEPASEPVPFNETNGWKVNKDYWFSVNLSGVDWLRGRQAHEFGKLYTTRMPRNVGPLPKKDNGDTDLRDFEGKVRENNVSNVIILVEDQEPPQVGSAGLVTYYESIGLNVYRYPIVDFTSPDDDKDFANRVTKLEKLYCHMIVELLHRKNNVLVHCWGGTGRTGTVILGLLRSLGCEDPSYCSRRHPGKSTYIETLDQERWLTQQPFMLSEEIITECPKIGVALMIDHVDDLLEAIENRGLKGIVKGEYGLSLATKAAIQQLIDVTDVEDIVAAFGDRATRLADVAKVNFDDGIDFDEMCALLAHNTTLDHVHLFADDHVGNHCA